MVLPQMRNQKFMMEDPENGEGPFKDKLNPIKKKKSKFTTIQHDEITLMNPRVPMNLRANDQTDY